MEQGFTVNTPLDNTGKLHIDIKLTGNLRPKFAEDGQAIDFYGSGSLSVLNYSKLKATDAGGTILPSRFEGINGGIRIVVEDTGALYPVTIDPLAATPAWTAESDQTGTEFGYSVGTAGDVNGDGYSDVIVGAYGYDNGQVHEGRAYVYLGGPSGLSANAAWTAEGDQQGAEFGTRVGTAGDVNGDGYSDVIVGAPGYDNGQANEGRVYVYLGGLSGLSACAAWTAESDQDYVNFGVSVGTAGDVNGDGYSDVIVGANNYSNGQTYEGRAYVYLGGPSGLSVSAGWTAESDQTEAHFGDSVGTAGDVNGDGYSDVIVGADWYDNGQANEGRAYVYLGGPSGLTASAGWTAEGDQEQAYFGNSVGTAGDVNGDGYSDVIVGAMFYDNGQADEGRAYVYLGGPSGLSATTGWTAEGNQESALFGIFVGTAGDVNGDGYSDIIVGAYGYDNGQANEGRAYVYLGGPGGISATAEWTAESDQEDTAFGRSVGTAGDVNGDGFSDVIVGAPWFGNGRAYVYLGGPSGIPASAGWTAESGQANANFGYSVGTAGDVNGDGYSDVIVGADRYSNGQYEEGRAYVYLGGPSGLSTSAVWTAESEQAVAHFGQSVGTAGDVNGDGYSDVIVGAENYQNGQVGEGRAYVYLGGPAGLADSAAWTTEGDQDYAYFGQSVGTAGDVNGDGYSDVIVGAFGYTNGQVGEGRAYVYLGGPDGLSANAAWTAEGDQEGAQFGYSVGTAGDVNGDGYSDVIVGAYDYDNGQTNEGRAYVYPGGPAGPSASAGWTAESDQDYAWFGYSVGTAGDVNGDGYSDVIVGAYNYDKGQTNEGRAYVYTGGPSGLSSDAAWTAEGDQEQAYFGNSVGTAGDVNGDGYSDVIVGAMFYDNGQADEGRAYVYLGGPSGLSATTGWTAEGNQESALFGIFVGTAGDVNGDGYSDIIVGAYGYDNGQANEGRAYVYLGGPGGISATAEWTAESDQEDTAFGRSVGTAGDVNGDGFSDVIVGAPWFGNGRAYVYLGGPSGIPASAGWTAESGQANANFGYSVGTAGDVNGDGYSDVIVGADRYSNGQYEEGRAYVYLGGPSGLSTSAVWTAESEQAVAHFGQSVGTAGDVNGDGYSDVIVGAENYQNGQVGEGRAYVYLGGPAGLADSAAWTTEGDQDYAYFGQSVGKGRRSGSRSPTRGSRREGRSRSRRARRSSSRSARCRRRGRTSASGRTARSATA